MFIFFQLSSRDPKELFPTSSSKSLEPTIAKYSETSFLLGRDNTSVLVEETQGIEIKKTIKWREAPIAVGKINIIISNENFFELQKCVHFLK